VIWPECHAKIYSPYTGKSRDKGEVVEKDGKPPLKGEKTDTFGVFLRKRAKQSAARRQSCLRAARRFSSGKGKSAYRLK
jgi:hypothetical protein